MRFNSGNGRSFDSLPSGIFGRERDGSTNFRKVAYTSGESLMSLKRRLLLRMVLILL